MKANLHWEKMLMVALRGTVTLITSRQPGKLGSGKKRQVSPFFLKLQVHQETKLPTRELYISTI